MKKPGPIPIIDPLQTARPRAGGLGDWTEAGEASPGVNLISSGSEPTHQQERNERKYE